jgi:hypothetical protein
MRNQQAIQEALIIEAGAEAEATAIIKETSSRSASPNLGLESLTTNEKMNRFLGTPEPEECSQEDYFNPMVFHPSVFESVCPKQALTITHPVVATTTTPANNVYIAPPQLKFRVSSDSALLPLLRSLVPSTTVLDAYAPPPLPSASVHSISIISKPVAGYAPPTTPPSAFISEVSQGMHPNYSLPIQSATRHQATLSQAPLEIGFTPRPRAVSPQVPPTTSAVPPYHGAYYRAPPYSNVDKRDKGVEMRHWPQRGRSSLI